MSYDHIKNFKSFKGKCWNSSLNDLVVLDNQIQDKIRELNEKIELINDIIRQKENERKIRRDEAINY
jgi:hypothetical protein